MLGEMLRRGAAPDPISGMLVSGAPSLSDASAEISETSARFVKESPVASVGDLVDEPERIPCAIALQIKIRALSVHRE